MQTLLIEDIHCYAFHGCLKEENRIGGPFSVSLELQLDLSKSMESDKLEHTADYVLMHQIVREEMAIASKLIEHVAARILKRLRKEVKDVDQFSVSVKKLNPPVNGQMGAATVVIRG